MAQSTLDSISDKVDKTSITRYKRRLDAKYPIRERDLRFPGRSTLLGCIWTKFAIVLVTTAFLIMHSMGLDGYDAIEEPLATSMILTDLAVGWAIYAIVSVFTYFYIRIKNPIIAILLFGGCCVVTVAAFLIWAAIAPTGGFFVISILIILISLIPFLTDIWGLLTYDKKVREGKIL